MVFFDNMGLLALTPGMVFMWIIGFVLIYLAITRQYEPLLLLPIGFGIIITNLPLAYLMEPGEGLIWRFYHYGIEWEVIPPLIFLGLGALTDFGALLAQLNTLECFAGVKNLWRVSVAPASRLFLGDADDGAGAHHHAPHHETADHRCRT